MVLAKDIDIDIGVVLAKDIDIDVDIGVVLANDIAIDVDSLGVGFS